MKITPTQSRAAQDLQERLYKLYLIARSSDLIVADDIKDAAEGLSVVIANSFPSLGNGGLGSARNSRPLKAKNTCADL